LHHSLQHLVHVTEHLSLLDKLMLQGFDLLGLLMDQLSLISKFFALSIESCTEHLPPRLQCRGNSVATWLAMPEVVGRIG
jgi:hypothetical protein